MRIQPSFELSEANALSVAQICQRVDGIPLAIELAAARTQIISVDRIVVRLDDRFRFLTGGSRVALPRQQTLQALVDWSYDLLPEAEKSLFCRLSIFVGGWTLEAAEEACSGDGLPGTEILDLMTRLVDKSLVKTEPMKRIARFRMLETIRQYARERLLASGEIENMSSRHLNYYSHLVEASEKGLLGSEMNRWLELLDDEKDNCYAALAWAVQKKIDNGDRAMQMAGGLWMWWLARGALSEARQWLGKALECGPRYTSPRAKALVSAGAMAWQQGELKEASRLLEEGISILHGLEKPDTPGLANATHIFGHVALDRADYASARNAFQESLDLYQAINDQYYVGTLISDLGMVAYHQREYASARLYQEKSLAIFQKQGNVEVISQTLHRIGELARLEGDYGKAEEYYETCLTNYRELGIKLEIASNLHKLGYVAQHYGNLGKARERFEESLSIQRQAGNKQGIAECLAGLAGLAAITGQPERALRLFAAVKAFLEVTGVPLAPADLVEWERDQKVALTQVDESQFTQFWSEGGAMDLDRAIEYAVQK
jgi:tetratricopeptide (TPR) repeat protein